MRAPHLRPPSLLADGGVRAWLPFLMIGAAALSNLALVVLVVLPHVGGWVEYLKISDFGMLFVLFEVAPVWAGINMALGFIAALLLLGFRNLCRKRRGVW